MTGIYKITNKVNGKVYIGQSIDIEQRLARHKRDANRISFKHYHYPLYRAIRKYGLENFSFEIVEECDRNSLNDREQFYIQNFQSRINGYNQTEGGDSGTHLLKLSSTEVDEIIHILKTSLTTTHSIGEKFNVSYSTIRDINVGKTYRRNEEKYPIRGNIALLKMDDGGYVPKTREKTFCCLCGEETRGYGTCCKKCSEISQRKCERPAPIVLAKMVKDFGFEKVGQIMGVSSRAIAKWCKSYGIPNTKKKLIDWYNQEMGIEEEYHRWDERKTDVRVRPVKQIDMKTGCVITTFRSALSAANTLGKTRGSHINDVCNGKRTSAYGYFWKYVE